MEPKAQQSRPTESEAFPVVELDRRLRRELEKAAAESDLLRNDWEPLLDSLRMVSILVKLEDLFDFVLRPEKIVRRGGYVSAEEGFEDMRGCLERLWLENNATRRSHEKAESSR